MIILSISELRRLQELAKTNPGLQELFEKTVAYYRLIKTKTPKNEPLIEDILALLRS